jgi:hypothetical protein
MPRKHIEFPPEQTHVAWLTPALLGFAVVCIILTIILIYTVEKGPFIGPWG